MPDLCTEQCVQQQPGPNFSSRINTHWQTPFDFSTLCFGAGLWSYLAQCHRRILHVTGAIFALPFAFCSLTSSAPGANVIMPPEMGARTVLPYDNALVMSHASHFSTIFLEAAASPNLRSQNPRCYMHKTYASLDPIWIFASLLPGYRSHGCFLRPLSDMFSR